MANVLGELFSEIANAIREKTGDTATMKPAEFPAKISGITVGGGSSEDVRYVTFMNGDTELYVKPVATGDDCVDVVAKGLIPAPTKASTAQYTYTHNGWSLTAGGAANASALSAVTEDRTVYAAFAASTRYYTVRFFDGTTLVDTVQVPYGGTAETTYEKTGYSLVGWTPSNVNITANTDCYGEWAAGNYIADDWATINANAASYDIGQKKTVTLNYADGTSETIDFTIVDKNVDKMQDGSMAALTFMADNAVKDSTVAASSNPQMDITQCDVMKEFLSGIFSAFPSDLQNVIKPVNKVNLGGYPQVFHIGPWNLTGKEGCWKGTYMDRPQMYQYKYFADGNETRRYKLNGTIAVYWLSTNAKAPNMNGTRYYDVYGNGTVTSSTHAESHDVVPCFCV